MDFVLHHSIVEQPAPASAAPKQVVFVLHGALGSGQNFRGIAKKIVEGRPDLALVLVDLRNHGSSVPAPPPQTLAAAAEDLHVLRNHLARTRPDLQPMSVVIGHSFGGKVAIEYARRHPSDVTQIWVLDSNPGVQAADDDHEIRNVIRAVRSVPTPLAARAAVIGALTSQGLSSGLANWMTTNIKRVGDSYDWTFDLGAIEALLVDYFGVDLWPFLETAPGSLECHLVVAELSDRWIGSMRDRVAHLAERGKVRYHVIPKAGHWLHVDNPQAVLELLVPHLGRPAPIPASV